MLVTVRAHFHEIDSRVRCRGGGVAQGVRGDGAGAFLRH